MRQRRATRLAAWLALAAVAIILTLTLWPMPGLNGSGAFWCVWCGELPGLDFLHNVALFVPLGYALVAGGWSWPRAALVGAALTVGIEFMQFQVVPGRDASLADIVANGTGALLGAVLAAKPDWRRPAARTAPRWLIGAAAGFAAILGATALLLVPSVPPDAMNGQWAPRRAYFDRFSGKVVDLELNGIAIPQYELPEPERYREAYLSGAVRARAHIVTGGPSAFGITTIARLTSERFEVFSFCQQDRDLVFRLRLASADLRVRTLAFAVPHALASPGEATRLEADVDRRVLTARAIGPSGTTAASITFATSLGWIFLLPWETPLGPWYQTVSNLWLAVLALPMGFYAGAVLRTRGMGAASSRGWLVLLVPAAAVALGLGVIPAIVGFTPPPWGEWASALAGVTLGLVGTYFTNSPTHQVTN